MNGPSSRLLALLTLLQGRRAWPGGELAGRLDVSGRTIRRDIDRLRELGYPVDALTGRPAGIACTPGPPCRRSCSTTTRPSRSPWACAPLPALR